MSLLRPVLLAALLGAAPCARAGVGRAVEAALPGEAGSFKTVAAPPIALQLPAITGLSPSLAPSPLAAAPLAPALLAPAPLAVRPALAAAALPAPAAPARPVDALRETGAALAKAEPASPEAASRLQGLYDGSAAPEPAAVAAEASPARGPSLAPPSPRAARKMPDGVKRAFQNSAVLGGGMAALGGGLFAWTQTLVSAPTAAQFALLAAPMLLIPFHFALVSAFWASRYYGYPKLSPAGKRTFERAWRAAAVAYPVAALTAMAFWLQLLGSEPAMLALMGLPLLVALGEITHHFLYRVVPERAQDKGKPLLDWRSRAGGNIGQQLKRMRRK